VGGGAPAPLLAHLVEDEQLTLEEIDALARRIRERR
jgi:hypothetical protein